MTDRQKSEQTPGASSDAMLYVVAAYLVLFAVGAGFPQRFDTELHAKLGSRTRIHFISLWLIVSR